MKVFSAAALVAIVGTANAFSTSSVNRASRTAMKESVLVEEPVIMEDPVPVLPTQSQALPFMTRPAALTGEMVGDVGFDPIGFAKTSEDLMNYREAEIKHARLAMLAAAGWPLSEVFDKKIAAVLNLAPLVDSNDRAPSLLNGGLGKVSPIYWIGCLGVAAGVELYGLKQKENANYTPGNLNFDPFGVYPKDKNGQEKMQLAELKNGRLAMIAITAFAVQEAVSSMGVVDETPFFFFPLLQTLHEYANTGYIQ
jgi:hypothetical protein